MKREIDEDLGREPKKKWNSVDQDLFLLLIVTSLTCLVFGAVLDRLFLYLMQH